MRRLPACLILILIAAAARADEPRKANRLARETSPYLLLHAHNPVDWHPWGPEAFEKAKKEGKPVFLSVGYSSCYWCHVMERESFMDAGIAETLNTHFINIKVDREERPDVDAIYMAALQAYSGTGGWPMSVFLFPDGRPFFAGTYFPPKGREGLPGFPDILKAVADAWRDHRPELEKDATNLTEAVRRATDAATARRKLPLTRSIALDGRAALAEQFDTDFGGFGFDADNPRRPKFPEPSNLLFLLDQHRRAPKSPLPRVGRLKGPEPLAMVVTTLDHMARGGIRDHLAGGYHRYSVNRSWSVPHFEKMLYDNAQLASTHLLAYELTGDARWKREAESTFAFIAGAMTSPDGGFFSALDAETETEEGAYYVWSRAEVERILGEDATTFVQAYGLDREPNFEGDRYVLLEPRPREDESLDAKLAPMRAKLLAVRDKRPKPLLDDKVLTSWNGLMIAALADGHRILKEDRHRLAAEKAADFLLSKHRSADGRLLRTSRNGTAKLPAYLEDYAFLAHGLLRLHASTGDAERLDQAKALADRMIDDFLDEKHGGFFATADDHESLIARPKDPFDNALPSGNTVAIRVLIELAAKTEETRYLDVAGQALDAFSSAMTQSPTGMPLMLVALGEYLDARPSAVGDRPMVVPSDDVLTGEAKTSTRAMPGGEMDVDLSLTIKANYHIYANPTRSETVKPTVVTLSPGSPAELVRVDYPEGKPTAFAGASEEVAAYEGMVALKARVRLSADAKSGPAELEFRVRYQACDDQKCLAPATLKLPFKITVESR